jgi:hypothetical protein
MAVDVLADVACSPQEAVDHRFGQFASTVRIVVLIGLTYLLPWTEVPQAHLVP